jgi:hypothetical protein
MRRRENLKPDANGEYSRQIGWKVNKEGTGLVQPRFRVGANERSAELAIRRLEQLWTVIEEEHEQRRVNGSKPVWDCNSLEVAKAIAKGASQYIVPRNGDDPSRYACRVQPLQRRFGSIIAIHAEDQEAVDEFNRKQDEVDRYAEESARRNRAWRTNNATSNGQMLHKALDAYSEWVKSEFVGPAEDGEDRQLTSWGRAQIRNIERLKERHPDMPLAALNQSALDAMFQLWRQRPMVKDTKTPMKVKSVQHHVKQLVAFCEWLHRSDRFDWRRPEDFYDIDTRVKETHQEKVARYTPIQAPVYSLDELTMLNQYATPIERFVLLLALNCAAGSSEIAGLLLREIFLYSPHPFAKLLRFETSENDSFIKGPRPKSGVYGEFLLWRETVRAIEWAIARRNKQTRISVGPLAGKDMTPTPDSHLFLTEQGYPLTRQTSGGNRNQRIPNIFDSLLRRVKKDHPDFKRLSLGKLRKTAGDLVKQFSDGEVAGVFLRHGKVVKTDDLADVYTNRPYGKMFAALRKVEEYLQPMFEATPVDPFPEKRKMGGPNITPGQIQRIRKMRRQGYKVWKIAEVVGVTRQTVHRYSKGLGPKQKPS